MRPQSERFLTRRDVCPERRTSEFRAAEKAEAGKRVTMTTINIGDNNDDVSELRGNEVIHLISI